jgi:hypothetical protein
MESKCKESKEALNEDSGEVGEKELEIISVLTL